MKTMLLGTKFHKVSFDQFMSDLNNNMPGKLNEIKNADEEMFKSAIEAIYNNIKLPERSTAGSAGYDFFCPMDTFLMAGASVIIPTGIRVSIDDSWFLAMFPRSSLGFKYRLQFDNTIPVIDSDYFNADNEGHIMLKITNNGTKLLHIKQGDKFAQGVFMPYGVTCNDDADGERHGGMGSTGR